MPRTSPGHDQRIITYRALRGSSQPFQRVNVAECMAWVQTTLTFDLEVRSPDDTAEVRPYIVDTFGEHHGAVEPTLYLTPTGKWFRRVFSHERPSLKPKPPLFIEVTQPFAEQWLGANGYPVPGIAAPVAANAAIRDRRAPKTEQVHAHRLWNEGRLSQAEVAREIERLFHVPYTQSQVSRAVKRVDDWLQAVNANLPKKRGRRKATVDPRRIEPKPTVPGNGKHVGRKVVDDDDD
jgi:hypothetical protein